MNIRQLESLTKEELIELIRHERWGEPVGEVAGTYKGAYSVGNVFFPKDGPLPSGTKLYTATQPTTPAQEPSVPDGWRLVPVDLTDAMMDAAELCSDDWPGTTWAEAWKRMLAAAPQPIEPCKTCNDRGAVGNILDTVPCPDCTPLNPVVNESLTVEPTDTERGRFECWAKKFMGMDITPNESCGYVSKKTLGAWYAWGAESRWRKRIDEAMRGEE